MTTVFWFVNACMLLLALAFVLLPIIRRRHNDHSGVRKQLNIHVHKEHLQELENELKQGNIDDEEFSSSKLELERGLLSDITASRENKATDISGLSLKTIIPVVVVLPIFVIVTYMALGDLAMISVQPEELVQKTDAQTMHSVDEMIEKLRTRLRNEPEDSEGWYMLGRSYMAMQRFPEAAKAFEQLNSLVGDQPNILVSYADALAMANNRLLAGKPEELIMRALSLEPDNITGLWLAGRAAEEKKQYASAINYWQRLLPLLQQEPESEAEIMQMIKTAQRNLDAPADSDIAPATGAELSPALATRSINVYVQLNPELLNLTSPQDTVFIFARAAAGPRMPLAIARKQVKDLPLEVTLDDSTAMSPAMRLSKFKQVVIGARVSKNGDAMPRSGDLSGTSTTIQPSEVSDVKISIDQVLP